MEASNRIWVVIALVGAVALIPAIPFLARGIRADNDATLPALILGAAILTAAGVIALLSALGAVSHQFAAQPEREVRYLSEVTAARSGVLPKRARGSAADPDTDVNDPDVDYTHDLPFVHFTGTIDDFKAAEIARMDDALRLHSMVGPDGYLDLENAAPCDLAWFYGHDYQEQRPYPSEDHECVYRFGHGECFECADLAALNRLPSSAQA